ncbi:sensor histidine kinase [Dokdonia sp. Hel_I_53]|uniref:sensor histidine kinase n=1 Tax=Dokdonia sp. Hel_I_53 TaxID=1566287 RepID=UPI001198FF98|nr:sensor histidine kinase [Dokdonia sp. Hel_I_53]TVZ51361.1 signal transduction histidine kinase [Dokdonia sp. Hel_I_53]
MNIIEDKEIQILIFTIIFGVFGLYHMLTYLVLRYKILLYYSILIFGLTAHWSLYFIDKSVQLQSSSISQKISVLTAMITIIGMLLFTKSYLNIRNEKYRILNSIYINFVLIAATICVFHIINWFLFNNVFLQKALSVIAALLALGAIILILFSGVVLFKKNRLNKYYLYSSWPLIFSALLYTGGWLLKNSFNIDKSILILVTSILVVLQLLLFSVIIGFKFKLIEETNFKLQLDINEDLQSKVAERTEELEVARQSLENKNADLEEINSIKNKLFSLITHDVRTPLQNFGSIIDLLESDLENDIKIELSNDLKIEISEKLEMINGLLQWSYKQMDGVQVKKESSKLVEVFENTKAEFTRMAKEKNIEIIIDTDSSSINIDRNMLKIILRNIVSNALKFSPKNSTVIIWSLTSDKSVEIGVQDSGSGMKSDWFLDFLSNKRPSTTLGTNGEKGTGFGLMITKDFVEMNGGEIFIDSDSDKGTTIRLLFKKDVI